jgi:hypothetical protein
MRALYLRQQERYQERWYKAKGQTPPNLGRKEEVPVKKEPYTETITDTYVLEGYQSEHVGDAQAPRSYWETVDAGMEPVEFRQSLNVLKSDTVVSWHTVPQPGSGETNRCFTPYENDVMSYGAFETTRLELKKRGSHLASEMKRVDDEFNRPPKKNWFCLKNSQFSIEHIRYNEMHRRAAAKHAFRDYYERQAEEEDA